jgi:hypothetical protein
MIPKCGTQRVHHWAHRGERACDSWWEPETHWHRGWKEKFPPDWQEVIRSASSGDKHIADVHTPHGLTIEFQHSHLPPDERIAREKFYGNMVWGVDGSRLRRDLPRFIEGMKCFGKTFLKGLYITVYPEEAFPANWLNCAAPVFFDFENAPGHTETTAHIARTLWCLLPRRVGGHAVVLSVSRANFVSWAQERAQPIPTQAILATVEQLLIHQRRQAMAAQMRATLRRRRWQHGKRRRIF